METISMNDFHKIKAESDRNSVLIIYASELAHVQNIIARQYTPM